MADEKPLAKAIPDLEILLSKYTVIDLKLSKFSRPEAVVIGIPGKKESYIELTQPLYAQLLHSINNSVHSLEHYDIFDQRFEKVNNNVEPVPGGDVPDAYEKIHSMELRVKVHKPKYIRVYDFTLGRIFS